MSLDYARKGASLDNEDLAAIIEELNAEPVVGLTLDAVVRQAVTNVPKCTRCTVFVRKGTDGIYDHHRAMTDAAGRRLDDLQLSLGQGPSLELSWDREMLLVGDLAEEERWPQWTPEALQLAVRSTMVVRLPLDGQLHACLSMYAREPYAFDEDTMDLAAVYARLAAVAVRGAWEVGGLRSALQGRLMIGVAQGILMQQYGVTLNQSFEVLRRRSTETNTKLRDLAREIVELNDPAAFAEGPDQEPVPN